jgi:ankyrin repeat protein
MNETPLHKAAAGGDKCEECLATLISKGADINATNNQGETPLDVAMAKGNNKIVELLKKHNARPGVRR